MFKNLRRNRKGFTLIELIVVIAILAILAAIAIPTFTGITDEANKSVEIANAKTIATAVNAYNALNPTTKITATSGITEATIGASLWPTGLPSDLTTIMARISFENGVAVVNTGDTPAATT